MRGGDNDAARCLLERYEPALRRIIRMRLVDHTLRRRIDADDVCQSVFSSLVVRLGLGQYDLASESDLLKLLATMVRNKVANSQRRQAREPHAALPLRGSPAESRAATDTSPSGTVVYQELLAAAQRLLSAEERELIALRQQGLAWSEVAARLGESPDGVRKRLARVVDLVVRQLGLDEVTRVRK